MGDNDVTVAEVLRTVPLKDMALVHLSDGRYTSFVGIGEIGLNIGQLLATGDIDCFEDIVKASRAFNEAIAMLPGYSFKQDAEPEQVDVNALLGDPSVHDWLKERIWEIDKRDIVDILDDTELLLTVIRQKFRELTAQK